MDTRRAFTLVGAIAAAVALVAGAAAIGVAASTAVGTPSERTPAGGFKVGLIAPVRDGATAGTGAQEWERRAPGRGRLG